MYNIKLQINERTVDKKTQLDLFKIELKFFIEYN